MPGQISCKGKCLKLLPLSFGLQKNAGSLTLLLQNRSHGLSLPSYLVRYDSSFNQVQPLNVLSEEELSLQSMVKRLCTDVIEPRVKEMDTKSEIPKVVVDELFKAGVSWTWPMLSL